MATAGLDLEGPSLRKLQPRPLTRLLILKGSILGEEVSLRNPMVRASGRQKSLRVLEIISTGTDKVPAIAFGCCQRERNWQVRSGIDGH